MTTTTMTTTTNVRARGYKAAGEKAISAALGTNWEAEWGAEPCSARNGLGLAWIAGELYDVTVSHEADNSYTVQIAPNSENDETAAAEPKGMHVPETMIFTAVIDSADHSVQLRFNNPDGNTCAHLLVDVIYGETPNILALVKKQAKEIADGYGCTAAFAGNADFTRIIERSRYEQEASALQNDEPAAAEADEASGAAQAEDAAAKTSDTTPGPWHVRYLRERDLHVVERELQGGTPDQMANTERIYGVEYGGSYDGYSAAYTYANWLNEVAAPEEIEEVLAEAKKAADLQLKTLSIGEDHLAALVQRNRFARWHTAPMEDNSYSELHATVYAGNVPVYMWAVPLNSEPGTFGRPITRLTLDVNWRGCAVSWDITPERWELTTASGTRTLATLSPDRDVCMDTLLDSLMHLANEAERTGREITPEMAQRIVNDTFRVTEVA